MDTLEARRMLTDYDRDPKAALAEMIREMDMDFDDTRPDSAAEEKALPTSLDPQLITPDAFRKAAELRQPETSYTLFSQKLLHVEMDGLEEFPEEKIRWFIGNFKLTQHPKYAALLTKGLSLKTPVQLASIGLDPLSLAQMDELRKAVPAVLSNEGFNAAYLAKLKPATPKILERDPAAHAAFLAKCRDYIITLPPANNDLKAHVLYHHLRLQQAQGNHPKPDLLAYLKLPRRNHTLIRPMKESKHFVNDTNRINPITNPTGIERNIEILAQNLVVKVPFEKGSASTVHALPEEFRKGNILIPAETENVKRLKILDSQAIGIRTNPADRTVQIMDPVTCKPLPEAYTKVYAETTGGSIDFHRDGYTDLRGKFDHLSTPPPTPPRSGDWPYWSATRKKERGRR